MRSAKAPEKFHFLPIFPVDRSKWENASVAAVNGRSCRFF
jgi:hypothetical protein